jgi:hypothetical protein
MSDTAAAAAAGGGAGGCCVAAAAAAAADALCWLPLLPLVLCFAENSAAAWGPAEMSTAAYVPACEQRGYTLQ